MKCRYVVLIVVLVLVFFGTPTVLAITTGDLFTTEDDRLNVLLLYTAETEDDPFSTLAVNGAYNACKENPNIDISIYSYPEKATDEDFNKLNQVIAQHPFSSKGYDMVIVASPWNILNPEQVSKMYPDILFVFIDSGNTSSKEMDNVRFFDFKGEESAFLGGYLAGMNTKTNIVGIVMGGESPAINRLRYGFEAGVQYAAKYLGIPIECRVSNIDTLTDEKKGESAALKLYQEGNGADIILNLASSSGYGVINAAKEGDFFVIGCDDNQSYLAPDNILCNVTKTIENLVEMILLSAADSKLYQDKYSVANINKALNDVLDCTRYLDLSTGSVDIVGSHSITTNLKEDIENLKLAICKNNIPIPYSKETMDTWSVVPLTKNQAPLRIDNISGGVL